MWRYLHRILQTNYLLSKRGFNLKPCQNFGNFEDLNHVFFDCPLYATMWVDVKGMNKILNIPIHNMPEALFQIELCSRPEKLKKLAYIFLAFAIHHTWLIRNDIKHNQLKINHNQFNICSEIEPNISLHRNLDSGYCQFLGTTWSPKCTFVQRRHGLPLLKSQIKNKDVIRYINT